jgi:hypothetical protein
LFIKNDTPKAASDEQLGNSFWGETFLPVFSPTAGELPERFETQRNANATGNPHPTGRKGTIWNDMQHNRMAPDRLCNQ